MLIKLLLQLCEIHHKIYRYKNCLLMLIFYLSTAMFKLLAVLALVSASVAHRYKGGHYRQTKNATYDYQSLTWDEAHEYEECDGFVDSYDEQDEGVGKDGAEALNDMHHFMTRHHPKRMEDICIDVEAGPVCPDFHRDNSAGHCGFETVIIPKGKWMVADIDMADEMGVRNAYKKKIFYKYRGPHKIRFVYPAMVKWQLNKNGERVKGEIAMYLPAEHQSNPPKSEYKEVRIEEWDETKVYLRPYGGYRDDAEFKQQFTLLRKAVGMAGLSYKDNEEWEAGYTYLRYGRQRIEAMVLDSSYKA